MEFTYILREVGNIKNILRNVGNYPNGYLEHTK